MRIFRIVAAVLLASVSIAACGEPEPAGLSSGGTADEQATTTVTVESTFGASIETSTSSTVATSTTGPSARVAEAGTLDLETSDLEMLLFEADEAAALMGVEMVEIDVRGFPFFQPEVPRGTAFEAESYWSLATGQREIGVGPVDMMTVMLMLTDDPADVSEIVNTIHDFDPQYVRWIPVTIEGAASADQSVAIPYEGEPTDEPAMNGVVASRDRFVVLAIAAGVDADEVTRVAVATAEAVLAGALELAG